MNKENLKTNIEDCLIEKINKLGVFSFISDFFATYELTYEEKKYIKNLKVIELITKEKD